MRLGEQTTLIPSRIAERFVQGHTLGPVGIDRCAVDPCRDERVYCNTRERWAGDGVKMDKIVRDISKTVQTSSRTVRRIWNKAR